MTRFFALCLLVLLGTFGAGLGAPPKPSGLPKIGIVSAIGDKFFVRKVGVTVFGNETHEVAIESWGIDDLMTAKIRAGLSGRFDVRPLTYRRAPFAALADSDEIFPREHRPELVRAGVSPHGLDGYLVVTKYKSQFSVTNQVVTGLGIVDAYKLIGDLYFVFANYGVALVDGRSWTVRAEALATVTHGLLGPRIGGAAKEVNKSFWPVTPEAAVNPRLKGAVVDIIDQTLPDVLQKIQLVQ